MDNKTRDDILWDAVKNGRILEPAKGGHDYVPRDGVAYWTCACGATMWRSGSRGPDPFGTCPLKQGSAWEQDAPDHWHRDVDDDVTLGVWPRGMPVRDWVWDVFDFRVDPEEPIRSGASATFEEATRDAELNLVALR